MTMIRCACHFVALAVSARAYAAPVLGLDLPREVSAREPAVVVRPASQVAWSLCSAHHGCQQGSSDDTCVSCCCVPADELFGEAPYPIVNVIAEPPAMQPRSLSPHGPRLRGMLGPNGSSDKELRNELADTTHLADSWKKSQ